MANDRLKSLLDGGRYFEAPRWQDGRPRLLSATSASI